MRTIRSNPSAAPRAPSRPPALPGSRALCAFAAAVVLLAACGKDDDGAATPAGPTLTVEVRPLSFPALSDVRYRLTVKTADQSVVWTRDVGSAAFGDGLGALTYVGTCDASPAANPHTVELVMLDLIGTNGQPLAAGSWQNPAPPERAAVLPATCQPQGDTAVRFNLTVMRAAEQGFFDVAVTFSDIFCSAKADCLRDGSPLELLFNPLTERRDTTVVMGFACTSGQTVAGAAEATWLHFTDVALQCDGAATIYFEPGQTAGQHGPLGTGFFESAIYRGTEQLAAYDKCYWNMAFGVDLAAAPRNCRLVAQATASHVSFAPDGHTPVDTIWPYVSWQIDLTDADGALACETHPLNGPDGGVSTAYTPMSGAIFQHGWRCGAEAPTTSSLACDGAFADATRAHVHPGPEGVSVAIGGQRSPTYRLPDGLALGDDAACCVNPCCAAP